MHSDCKAKKFQDRMSHRGSGKAMGEKGAKGGVHGHTAGEMKIGLAKMNRGLRVKSYPHSQSSDGNGGK